MDPATVIRLVHALGGTPPRVLVVGCEPSTVELDPDGGLGLSPPVEAALDEAVAQLGDWASNLRAGLQDDWDA